MEVDAGRDGLSDPCGPSSPALTPPGRSFYDPRSNARPFIARVNDPENSEMQDVSLSAWQLVAQACFPDTEPQHDEVKGATWAVVYHAFPEGVGQKANGPMMSGQRLLRVRLHVENDGNPGRQHPDVVTIECDSPNGNSPTGWKSLIENSRSRLAECAFLKTQIVIIAIGTHFLPFRWDRQPKSLNQPSTTSLSVEGDILTLPYDDRLQPVRMANCFSRKQNDIQGSATDPAPWELDLKKIPSILVRGEKTEGEAVDLERFLLQVRKEALVEHGVLAPT